MKFAVIGERARHSGTDLTRRSVLNFPCTPLTAIGRRIEFPYPYVLESANVRQEHEWHVWEDIKLPDGDT